MTDITEIYTCTPRQAREFVVDAIRAGLVPFLKSSPGLGKSSIMRSVAKEFRLKLIDHRLSTSTPEDLSGLPNFVNGRATFTPFDLFPTEDTPIPAGYDGFMLFLDEANHGTKMVQAASYKLVLDRMVGQSHLHPNTAITMAGNLATDRAFVNPLSTAMQSRVVHIKMVPSLTEWLEDVAISEDYDERIIAYLQYKGVEALMDFKPDHQNETFCSPRTWEFMNNLVKGQQFNFNTDGTYDMDRKTPLYAGTITAGTAVDFVQFTKVYRAMPGILDVVANPTGLPIPKDTPTKWAVTSHLCKETDDTNFDLVVQYVNRMDMGFRVLFFRWLKATKPELRHHPAFAKGLVELAKYLSATD